MSTLMPGDLVLFVRLTLRDIRSWRDVLGWLSNWTIALTQRIFSRSAQGDYDGFWECIHAAVILPAAGGAELLESTAKGGLELKPPGPRIGGYAGAVIVIPLNSEYRRRFSDGAALLWWNNHRHDRYRWGGLPFALLFARRSYDEPGAMFCSEAVLNFYQALGIVPAALPVLRGKRIVQGRLLPQCYSPAECAQLPQLARSRMYDAKEALRWAQ